MSISSEDISYLLKAHSFVKKAEEAEQLGIIDDAIEYNFQASNYFTLAIKQTNHEQTIEALKVLSLNHYRKSTELQNHSLNNNEDDMMNDDNVHNININMRTNNNNINTNNNHNNMYFMQENFVNNSNINNINMYNNNNKNRYENDINKQLESTVELYLSTSNTKLSIDELGNEYNFQNNNTMHYGLSPPSSFWMGIEKLLEILPKPIFGNRRGTSGNSSGTGGESSGINALTDSFFIVNNQQQQNELNQQLPQLNDNNNKGNSSNNNNNNNRKSSNHESPDIKALLEENNTLKKENDFLKDRILQFRSEIEKKASKIREQSNVTRSTIINNVTNNTIPHYLNNVSLSTFTPSTTFIDSNKPTVNNKNNDLLKEIQRLKEQLEEKEQIIDSQNQRWNKLVDGAKKKREMNSSNLTPNLISISPSSSPSSTTTSINIIHQHQKVPNPF